MRAFEDIGGCVAEILAGADVNERLVAQPPIR
jgi:hypothetical protein